MAKTRTLSTDESRVIALWQALDGLWEDKRMVGALKAPDERALAVLTTFHRVLKSYWSVEDNCYIVTLTTWDLLKYAQYQSARLGITCELDGSFTLHDGYVVVSNND